MERGAVKSVAFPVMGPPMTVGVAAVRSVGMKGMMRSGREGGRGGSRLFDELLLADSGEPKGAVQAAQPGLVSASSLPPISSPSASRSGSPTTTMEDWLAERSEVTLHARKAEEEDDVRGHKRMAATVGTAATAPGAVENSARGSVRMTSHGTRSPAADPTEPCDADGLEADGMEGSDAARGAGAREAEQLAELAGVQCAGHAAPRPGEGRGARAGRWTAADGRGTSASASLGQPDMGRPRTQGPSLTRRNCLSSTDLPVMTWSTPRPTATDLERSGRLASRIFVATMLKRASSSHW